MWKKSDSHSISVSQIFYDSFICLIFKVHLLTYIIYVYIKYSDIPLQINTLEPGNVATAVRGAKHECLLRAH